MTTVLTLEQVLADIEEIVAAAPHTRFTSNTEAGCIYGTRGWGSVEAPRPVCVVGHLLFRRLPVDDWEYVIRFHNSEKIGTMLDNSRAPVKTDGLTVRYFLSYLQSAQDHGDSWAEALETARKRMRV